MQNILHYGIIGCGMMGQEHIRNIQLLPGTKVSATYEPDANMRQMARTLVPDIIFADSIRDLLNIEPLDCLIIASPNYLHCDQLEEISVIRQLPILIEKPLFTDPEDTTRIQNITANFKAPIWVAMEYRYMPPIAKFIEDMEATTGTIKMLSIREHRYPFLPKVNDWNRFNDKTGGTLVEKCCHFFDLMCLMIKSKPMRIMASSGQSVNHLDEVYNGKTADIWDNGYVIVDFENGTRSMLDLCMFAEGSKYQEEITAIGARGKIEVRVPGPARFWAEQNNKPPVAQIIFSPRNTLKPVSIEIPVKPELLAAGDHNGATFYQHEKFMRVVRQKQKVEVTVNDGINAVKMGFAAQKSALTGQSVRL